MDANRLVALSLWHTHVLVSIRLVDSHPILAGKLVGKLLADRIGSPADTHRRDDPGLTAAVSLALFLPIVAISSPRCTSTQMGCAISFPCGSRAPPSIDGEKLLPICCGHKMTTNSSVAPQARDLAAQRRQSAIRQRAYRARGGEQLKERVRTSAAAYYAANRTKRIQNARSWNQANPTRHRASNKKWRMNHPEESREHRRIKHSRRRAAKGDFTLADWRALVARSRRCFYCRRKFTKVLRPTHDHLTPLSKGGANSPENSVCACKKCNSRKRDGRFNPINGQGLLI